MANFFSRWFGGRRRRNDSREPALSERAPFDLNYPLCWLSPIDPFTVGNACEGVQIFGSPGSGKTSGSGRALARAYLRAGFGGLVLTAKKDETALWQRYAEESGRSQSLMIFSPSQPWRFNFMEYEMKRPGAGAGLTENLVRLFTTVLEASERGDSDGGKGQKYWDRALRQLLRNAIDLASAARGTVSLPLLHQIITSAPQAADQVHAEGWQTGSLCYKLIEEADKKEMPAGQKRDFQMSAKFWLTEFPMLPPETRGSIVSTFTTMADGFLRGVLRELFCTSTNMVPELTHNGAVIVLDLPVKEYGELGVISQVLFKYIWQLAAERRNTEINPRPVFLFADESQNFLAEYDMQFGTTARSSRACMVYLTQNLSNYYAVLPGDKGRAQTDSLMGTLVSKVFHSQSHSLTNTYAADLFAKRWQARANRGWSSSEKGGPTASGGESQSLDYLVQPAEFTMLRKGGERFGLYVDAIIFQGGRVWDASGTTALRTSFFQEDV